MRTDYVRVVTQVCMAVGLLYVALTYVEAAAAIAPQADGVWTLWWLGPLLWYVVTTVAPVGTLIWWLAHRKWL